MESIEKLEFIERAIQKMVAEDARGKGAAAAAAINDGDQNEKDREEHLLSKLLSEVEQLKAEDSKLEQAGRSAAEKEGEGVDFGEEKSNKEGEKEGGHRLEVGAEEIVKELRKVRRQNVITHCLLSVMIVLTVAWQLSEVSLILKLKDGFSHPFRSFGGLLTGLVKGPATDTQDGDKNHKSSPKQQQAEILPVSPLKLPELPHVDLGFTNGEKHSSP